jgi:energy-coupling factor transporter ATP-binding protein EcfA2
MKLSVESLSFRYIGKKEAALTDINLEATGGELLFLVGGNGSGKTTLLSCIAGLRPDIIE